LTLTYKYNNIKSEGGYLQEMEDLQRECILWGKKRTQLKR